MQYQKDTEFGRVIVTDDAASIEADNSELVRWTRRPGAVWPCSDLARYDYIRVVFDRHGLVELQVQGRKDGRYADTDDITSAELNAWSSDLLGDVIPEDHPLWFITVGQFS